MPDSKAKGQLCADFGATDILMSRIRRKLPFKPVAAQGTLADRVLQGADEAIRPELAKCLANPAVEHLIGSVGLTSPYLSGLIEADANRLWRILNAAPQAAIEALAQCVSGTSTNTEADLLQCLRLAKQEAALTIGLADLAKAVDTMAATAMLARFADAALSASVDFALSAQMERGKIRLPDPSHPSLASGYIVLAMGKHGANELNYSSDIDLIVFFDAARARPLLAEPDEVTDFFVRVTKQVVRLMQSVTSDGYVFRIDLRLRPDPGATPIAMSTDAAMQYYGSIGQNWERAALIKARAVAGDLQAGEAFLGELKPFIWRKSLDYAAIADVHSIKRQIHAARDHGEIAVAGHDVKLGRGGIREIEFFVQTQQLIAGGRNPALRRRETLGCLDELAVHGWIEPKVRDELAAAYVFLRDVEHRIQMVADQQTHTLPDTEAGVARIAGMMGFERTKAFAARLIRHLETVQRHSQRLFEHTPALSDATGSLVFTGAQDDPETLKTLAALGFAQPSAVTTAIRAWHFGRYNATRSSVARERLTELTPALLKAFAATGNADEAFHAFDRCVAKLPTGVQIFSLLASNPGLLDLLAQILSGAAPRLADVLTRRPRVIDALLEPAFFGPSPDLAEVTRRLDLALSDAASYEDCLDRVRIFAQEQMFLIGVRVLTGSVAAIEAGRDYATLAVGIVERLLARVESELAISHGRIPGGEAVVVAMGKLGGAEMTASSDLDLMLIYDVAEDDAMSDGERPLAPSQYYARLAQRLVTALSVPTAEGRLYAVDFRLRPSGNKGPLATSLKSFVAYHAADAWTWEHMALTRARVLAGAPTLSLAIDRAIRAALTAPRDLRKCRSDVIEMRSLMAAEKATDDIWDLKQVAGGLVDIEFLAQYLMLCHAAGEPDLLSQHTGTALQRLMASGHLKPSDAAVLLPALNLYSALTQVLRLAHDGQFRPAEAGDRLKGLLAGAGGLPSFAVLEAHIKETEEAVRATFIRLLGKLSK